MWNEILNALNQTILAIILSGLIVIPSGLMLGLYLAITYKTEPDSLIGKIFRGTVILVDSIPYIVFIMLLVPITNYMQVLFSGNILSFILPMILAGFISYTVNIMKIACSMPKSMLDMAQGFGATNGQIMKQLLLPQLIPEFCQAGINALINLISYSAISGALCRYGLGGLLYTQGITPSGYKYVLIVTALFLLLTQTIRLLSYLVLPLPSTNN